MKTKTIQEIRDLFEAHDMLDLGEGQELFRLVEALTKRAEAAENALGLARMALRVVANESDLADYDLPALSARELRVLAREALMSTALLTPDAGSTK